MTSFRGKFQILADIVRAFTTVAFSSSLPVSSPLNQYDLPIAVPVLQFSQHIAPDPQDQHKATKIPETPIRPLVDSPLPAALEMTVEQIQNNPLLDYTTPDLVTLVISDIGILTPSVNA